MAGKGIENKDSNSLAAIVFSVWAVSLLIAFFSYRGADVGQLQNLIGNLGGGKIFGETGLTDSFLGLIVSVFILQAWFGIGSFAAQFINSAKNDEHSQILEFAMKTALGAAIWSLIWFFLGLAGAYSTLVAVISLVLGTAFIGLNFRRFREPQDESRVANKWSTFDKILTALIAIPVLLAFAASLAPPTSKDTLLYHFALPKAFIAQGSNGFVDGNIASFLALGTEMHTVWAMLLGGFFSPRAAEIAAGATIFLFFPLLLSAIYGLSRELKIERSWSLLAVLIVAGVPTVFHVASGDYADLSLALYVTLAIYALGRWWKSEEKGLLIYIAAFLGAALSVKLTTLFVIAAFALVIMLRARKAKEELGNVGKILAGGSAALLLAGVIASPWYLRTWWQTGSPVFPFYMSIWEGRAAGWDVERSNLFQMMNSQYGGVSKGISDYLLAPFNISVIAQPEQATLFDGVIGVAFLIGLPVLIWGLWKFDLATEIKIAAGVSGIMFFFWLFSSQQLRYLLPILPVLAIGICAAAQHISEKESWLRKVWQFSLAASAAAGILVTAAWFLQKAPMRVVLGGESRDEYLARNLDYYPYYQTLNTETPTDAKVWLINMRRDTYDLNRPYFSDYLFEDWTLRKLVWESSNSQELKAKAAAMGVQYVLTRHDFLFDYAQSSLVDDTRPRQENEAKLKIAREFILDTANTIRADKKFSLVKVF